MLSELYSVGECPVCPGAGYVLALRTDDGRSLFYCPSCGTAWPAVPDPKRVDTVARLADLAPHGVYALTREEVAGLGLKVVEVLARTDVDAELRRQLK